ncbi:MAG: hypothetical protein M3229_01535, partial [Actinomycetota bacterium]|nr:hypothetical protein [Actinomycetota bacterium]
MRPPRSAGGPEPGWTGHEGRPGANVRDLAPEAVVPRVRGRLGTPYTFVARCASTQALLAPDAPEG